MLHVMQIITEAKSDYYFDGESIPPLKEIKVITLQLFSIVSFLTFEEKQKIIRK